MTSIVRACPICDGHPDRGDGTMACWYFGANADGDHLAQFKADQLDAWERRLAQFSNRSDSTGYVGRVGVEVLTELRLAREQADALAAALAEVFRETEHINTRRGSRNGRIREVAEAALRAYREGTK